MKQIEWVGKKSGMKSGREMQVLSGQGWGKQMGAP